jgi:hypothetical protein
MISTGRSNRAYWVMLTALFIVVEGCSGEADTEDSAPNDTFAGETDTVTEAHADTGSSADIDADTAGNMETGTESGTGSDEVRFTVETHLASDEAASAPGTVGIVTWSVNRDRVTDARIEFGLDGELTMTAPVNKVEAENRTLLLGMKPDRTYTFQIVADEWQSEMFTIETGPPTDLVRVRRFDVYDALAREPGFIVTSYWQGQEKATAFIIDSDGEIVWWYESPLNGICRARMSADGKNMWMVVSDNNGGLIARTTMDTLDGQTYDVGASHDLTAVKGEVMAYLDYSEGDCDSIFEIVPDGTVAEVVETQGAVTNLRCHGNALRYSKTEDVYTYSDVASDIYVFDRTTAKLLWKLSDRVGSNTAWGGSNHGHHLLDDSILVFGNHGGTDGNSAAFEYTLDGRQIRKYDSGLRAQNLGDVQRLPGGDTLVSYSNDDSYIHEIDDQNNLVMRIDLGAGGPALGYIMWRPSLYGPPSDIDL